jgi:hypothetical protein
MMGVEGRCMFCVEYYSLKKKVSKKLYAFFRERNLSCVCTPAPNFIDRIEMRFRGVYAGLEGLFYGINARATRNYWQELRRLEKEIRKEEEEEFKDNLFGA